jgi:hypothetical protein
VLFIHGGGEERTRKIRRWQQVCGIRWGLYTRCGRLIQLTPPRSDCSIHMSSGMLAVPARILEGLMLVVSDIEAARAELVERGVEASPVQHLEDGGVWVEGRGGEWNSFVFFSDPDGNSWVLQERPTRN